MTTKNGFFVFNLPEAKVENSPALPPCLQNYSCGTFKSKSMTVDEHDLDAVVDEIINSSVYK